MINWFKFSLSLKFTIQPWTVQTTEAGNMSGSSHGQRFQIFEHYRSYIRLLCNLNTDLHHPWYHSYQVSILVCLSVCFICLFVKMAKPIGPKFCIYWKRINLTENLRKFEQIAFFLAWLALHIFQFQTNFFIFYKIIVFIFLGLKRTILSFGQPRTGLTFLLIF